MRTKHSRFLGVHLCRAFLVDSGYHRLLHPSDIELFYVSPQWPIPGATRFARAVDRHRGDVQGFRCCLPLDVYDCDVSPLDVVLGPFLATLQFAKEAGVARRALSVFAIARSKGDQWNLVFA